MGFLNSEGLQHFWNKIRDALSEKQDRIWGLPGQIAGFNRSNELVAMDDDRIRPNLLDNWYFAGPVNQRGQTEYTGEGYTIDRWKMLIDIGAVSLEPDGIVLDASENPITFTQPLEPGVLKSLKGRTITTSALYTVLEQPAEDKPLGIGYGIPEWNEYVSLRGETDRKTLSFGTLSIPESTYEIIWMYIPAGCRIKLHAIKTELGETQTLAHQDANGTWMLNGPPPDKTMELLKCQRYMFSPRVENGTYYPIIGYAMVVGEDIWAGIAIPAPMRVKPELSGSGGIVVRHGSTAEVIPVSEWTVTEIGATHLTMHAATSRLSDGDVCDVYLDGPTARPLFDSSL